MERSDKIERRYVYARFSEEDQGRSRIFVASCESEADAQAISATLDLLAVVEEGIEWWNSPSWRPSQTAINAWLTRAQHAVAKARGGTQ